MEATARWGLVTATAPIAWGTTYYVTHQFLPPDYPLYGSVLRALPAGLLLALACRQRPHGSWWWRSLVLGVLNVGAFFALIYAAAQLLPTSVASTIMATSPVMMMLLAWLILADRPKLPHLAGAGVGLAGVCLMLLTGATAVNALGVLASISAMAMSSIGYILLKKWAGQSSTAGARRSGVCGGEAGQSSRAGAGQSSRVDLLPLTSWQLLAGGLVLLPVAVAVEGAPPALDGPALLGFGYVTVIATAVAFAAWFNGLRRLSAGTVGLIGLLNPVTGVLLGTVLASERLAVQQLFGLVLVLLGVLLGQPAVARLLARRRERHRREWGGDGQRFGLRRTEVRPGVK